MAYSHVKRRCPTCYMLGDFIQITPIRLRRCKNGHEWEDSKKPYIHVRVPLTVRLEEARKENDRLRGLLLEAYRLVQDYHQCLTVPQRVKVGDGNLMYRLKEELDKPPPT